MGFSKKSAVQIILVVALCIVLGLGQNISYGKPEGKTPGTEAGGNPAEDSGKQVLGSVTAGQGNIPAEPVMGAVNGEVMGSTTMPSDAPEAKPGPAGSSEQSTGESNYAAMISAKIAQRYASKKALLALKDVTPDPSGPLESMVGEVKTQDAPQWMKKDNTKFMGEVCQKVPQGGLYCSGTQNCATDLLAGVVAKTQRKQVNELGPEEKKQMAEAIISIFSSMSNPLFALDVNTNANTQTPAKVGSETTSLGEYVKNKVFELRVKNDFNNNPEEYVEYLVQKYNDKKVPVDEMCIGSGDSNAIGQCVETWLRSSINVACAGQLANLTEMLTETQGHTLSQRNFAAVIINREFYPEPSSGVIIIPPKHYHDNCDEYDQFMFESGYKMSQFINAAFSA